jgi:DNA-directed RNA polymerase subunit beta'
MGLPRIEELFELRPSKNPAVMCEEEDFVLDIKEKNNENVVVIGKKEYIIPFGRRLLFKIGDKVKKGSLITDGAADIRNLFAVAGIEKTQNYILSEVSKVYTTQGALINDKHTEIIVRQMFSRHRINDTGNTKFNKGSIVEKIELIEENEKMKSKGKEEAKASRIVMPISRVSLSSASFLSAASFQDTARVLIASAIEGAEDKLRGLKENVIIGRLIPAGTGFRKEYFNKEDEDEEDFLDDDE